MADLTFFSDGDVDRVLGVVVELAGEVYVLRERLRTVEHLLETRGSIARADLDAFVPDGAEQADRLADRDRFIARILRPMTDEADSPNPPFEPA